MDPIGAIHFHKDSTLAMLLEAAKRGYELYYFELSDIYLRDGVAYGFARLLSVKDDAKAWYAFTGEKHIALRELDVILMRKDPPFNEQYIYSTYILEHAERQGVLVVNKPQALRDANEKMFATEFPQCCPPTIVTRSIKQLDAFWHEHTDIVCKPLNGMGGLCVFRLRKDDVNAHALFQLMTNEGSQYIMAQRFIPEITAGDTRVLLIDGEPVPHVLARVPQGDDWRGNLAVGAKGIVRTINEAESKICAAITPTLREKGLFFVGIDVIGGYLTEINVTSPTCIREIDAGAGINIAAKLFDMISART